MSKNKKTIQIPLVSDLIKAQREEFIAARELELSTAVLVEKRDIVKSIATNINSNKHQVIFINSNPRYGASFYNAIAHSVTNSEFKKIVSKIGSVISALKTCQSPNDANTLASRIVSCHGDTSAIELICKNFINEPKYENKQLLDEIQVAQEAKIINEADDVIGENVSYLYERLPASNPKYTQPAYIEAVGLPEILPESNFNPNKVLVESGDSYEDGEFQQDIQLPNVENPIESLIRANQARKEAIAKRRLENIKNDSDSPEDVVIDSPLIDKANEILLAGQIAHDSKMNELQNRENNLIAELSDIKKTVDSNPSTDMAAESKLDSLLNKVVSVQQAQLKQQQDKQRAIQIAEQKHQDEQRTAETLAQENEDKRDEVFDENSQQENRLSLPRSYQDNYDNEINDLIGKLHAENINLFSLFDNSASESPINSLSNYIKNINDESHTRSVALSKIQRLTEILEQAKKLGKSMTVFPDDFYKALDKSSLKSKFADELDQLRENVINLDNALSGFTQELSKGNKANLTVSPQRNHHMDPSMKDQLAHEELSDAQRFISEVEEEIKELKSVIQIDELKINDLKGRERAKAKGRLATKQKRLKKLQGELDNARSVVKKFGSGLPNLDDLAHEIHVLIGEVQAGNDSPHIKKKIASNLKKLVANNQVTQREANRVLSKLN